ncbi:hypothetical protein TIFTF001_022041 [Ficus carica]|uniref:Uncharacterized protein n=1 Tax=Ficus carica TaxID=3494 RepID=A0AA88DJX2_FICCA|nr:hypothetical protein TIFTF001_022041 [Ficus carica]
MSSSLIFDGKEKDEREVQMRRCWPIIEATASKSTLLKVYLGDLQRDPSRSFISMTIFVKIVRPRFEQQPNLWDTIMAFLLSASRGCSRIQSHICGGFLHVEERSNRHGEAEESRRCCSLCMERENEKVGVLD